MTGRTRVPSIYAVGDVTDRAALTPVAIREGHAFADTLFSGTPVRVDHEMIPTAVFTQPEIGTVGLSERAARQMGEVEIYRSRFRPMINTLAGRQERMLMKLIVSRPDRRVMGCHIVGHGAGEMSSCECRDADGRHERGLRRDDGGAPTAAEELVTMRTASG